MESSLQFAQLEAEREHLLELLAQQQRLSQIGLVTAGLAHDVDNHVQAISGAAFLALRRENPEDWRRALEKVQAQCCALTETTRAFLSFVRRQDTAAGASFGLTQVLEDTHGLTKPLARRRGVALAYSLSADAEVAGERTLAVQALVNLVTNAVRACADGEVEGRVSLEASCPCAGAGRIEVRDNGPGIPAEVSRRLFRPFASGHREDGGTGLGLFIVRQNIRRLGGTIRVRSSTEGTRFEIDLPCAG